MKKLKSKPVKTLGSQTKWDNLIVTEAHSLPKGVFMLFVTSAKSPISAAQKKAERFGIPGEVYVVQQHPLNKITGKDLFKEMLNSLKPFPFGDSDCLVKATPQSISQKFSKLSSEDINQIELRKQVFEQEIDDLQILLDELKRERNVLKLRIEEEISELEKLDADKLSLMASLKKLDERKRDKERQVEEMENLSMDISDLESEKSELKEEIEILRETTRELGGGGSIVGDW